MKKDDQYTAVQSMEDGLFSKSPKTNFHFLQRLPVDEEKVDRMMAEVKDLLLSTYFASVFCGKAADFFAELLSAMKPTDFLDSLTYDAVMQYVMQ